MCPILTSHHPRAAGLLHTVFVSESVPYRCLNMAKNPETIPNNSKRSERSESPETQAAHGFARPACIFSVFDRTVGA